MDRDDHSRILLETLRLKLSGEERTSGEELRALLGLCNHPARDIRESALDLLLQPPVRDDVRHFRHLIDFLMKSGMRIRQLPTPLLEFLCELITVHEKPPGNPQMGLFFVRIMKNLPKAFLQTLCSESFPLAPCLPYIPFRSYLRRPTRAIRPLKRRWRHLCRRLVHSPAPPSWAQPTFADIGALFKGRLTSRGHAVSSGRWLLAGRTLVQPVLNRAGTIMAAAPIPLSRSSWRCAGPATLRYLDHLVKWQADELRSMREVCHTVSQRTRRVVLSWHNATLAASGGWAFENLCDIFPLKPAWQNFKSGVEDRIRDVMLVHDYEPTTLAHLWELWQKRLVIPKLHHLLCEDRMAVAFDMSAEASIEKSSETAQSVSLANERDLLSVEGHFNWSGALSPHQRFSFHDILNWSISRRNIWEEGLLRLVGLMKEGQVLLNEGTLPYFVLPWIDKFFISSRRKEDWEYLTILVQWLEKQGAKPLILFWEDTPHPREPSLKLTLKELRSQGYPYRGIGLFGWDGSSRRDAVDIIADTHHETVLFALRPHTDCHNFRPLGQLLENRDYRFFQDYDSSWKDGLCFLYAGTQVFPLLSVQSDRENFPAWISVSGMKVPFGSYLRSRVREAVLGKSLADDEPFSLQYALWANLC